nr:MAG TPA: hypothetical protein [Caudoviricetes sp.]
MSLPVVPEIVNTVRKFYQYLQKVREEIKEITDRIKQEASSTVVNSLQGVQVPFIRCVNEWAPQAATVLKNTQHKIGKAVQCWDRNTQRNNT